MPRRLTTEEFIVKAKNVHGNKYDYSQVIYCRGRDKISISCPHHGEFLQSAYMHLQKRGCPKCAIIETAESQRWNTSKFISRAKIVHGDNYDYSKVKYNHSQKKVCIICKIHGEFWQVANNHLNGSRCPICKVDYSDERFIHYLYKITNIINNKIYIGIHSTFNINDGYMGSGILLKEEQSLLGIKNFHKNILAYCQTREELQDLEKKMVTPEFISRSDTYNLVCGG